MSAYVSPKHSDALRIIRAFATDWSHMPGIIDGGVQALVEKAKNPAFTPSQREEAKRCVETVRLFQLASNAFGVNGLPLRDAPSFTPMTIEGAIVSVQPDLIVAHDFPLDADDKLGLIFIRPQKRPDPDNCKKDETRESRKEYRMEVARYLLVLGWMQLRAEGIPDAQINKKLMRVWDIRMGESIGFPSDRVSRERRIKAACGQIARLWETVEPKPADLA